MSNITEALQDGLFGRGVGLDSFYFTLESYFHSLTEVYLCKLKPLQNSQRLAENDKKTAAWLGCQVLFSPFFCSLTLKLQTVEWQFSG